MILKKIEQNSLAMFRQDALGMKLHANNWILFMPHTHHFSFAGEGNDLQAFGQRFLNNERVVTSCLEGAGNTIKKAVVPMIYR